jgi:hypothetical protein
MIRIQVSLDKVEYKLARKEARTLEISVAEFVNRATRQTLPPAAAVPWMRYAGFVESGDKCTSQSVDGIVLWRQRLNPLHASGPLGQKPDDRARDKAGQHDLQVVRVLHERHQKRK